MNDEQEIGERLQDASIRAAEESIWPTIYPVPFTSVDESLKPDAHRSVSMGQSVESIMEDCGWTPINFWI